MDISIDEVNLSEWLTLTGNPLTVEFRPPSDDPEPEPEPEPDQYLLPVNMTCEDIEWSIVENDSSMTIVCDLTNFNPVRISVDIDIIPPTGGVEVSSWPNMVSLAANESKSVSLEARALVNATAGAKTLIITLPVSAGGWISNSSIVELDYLVISANAPETSGQTNQQTDGIAGWMWGAIAGFVVLLVALFILTTRRRSASEVEEEQDDIDWMSTVEGEFKPPAPDRGTELRDARPLDDIMPTRARPRDDELDEGERDYEEYMDDESYHVDADGVEWWKDEEEVWWYRYPDEEDWSEYRDE